LRKSFPAAEVARAAGAVPVRWRDVVGGGYASNSARWRVELADGRAVFVKLALDEMAAEWLRDEHRLYSALEAPFLPDLVGWGDGEVTFLVLEDLSEGHWPPPWREGEIDAVLAALATVAAVRPPAGLPPLEDLRERLNGWQLVADDPEPLLSTGLCSRAWLDAALGALHEAAATCDLSGASLVHLDVRGDNLCVRDGRVLFVDWNLACVGNPLIDVVAWLPSLRLEGGPEPWELVPDTGGLAALLAGYFASRAGLPTPPTAPRVRPFQRAQAEVALPWAVRELGLPPILAP
jgi:aminoglycoside phosphotransferase (APT) family kinase protein